MLRSLLAACALLCALAAPLRAEPSANFLEGVRSIDIVMHRELAKHARHARRHYMRPIYPSRFDRYYRFRRLPPMPEADGYSYRGAEH
jgi:hypothetical protein